MQPNPPTPPATPTRAHPPAQPNAKRKEKAKTSRRRISRIDPLVEAIKDNLAIAHIPIRVSNWIRIAELCYPKGTNHAQQSGIGDKSKNAAKATFKLLKQLEAEVEAKQAAKEAKLGSKKSALNPLPEASGSELGLANGPAEVQASPPPDPGL